jgi:hypothetical protein
MPRTFSPMSTDVSPSAKVPTSARPTSMSRCSQIAPVRSGQELPVKIFVMLVVMAVSL